MKEKFLTVWASVVATIGIDWAVAVVIGAVLALFVHPVLGIIVGAGYVAYKRGQLDAILAKFKKTDTTGE